MKTSYIIFSVVLRSELLIIIPLNCSFLLVGTMNFFLIFCRYVLHPGNNIYIYIFNAKISYLKQRKGSAFCFMKSLKKGQIFNVLPKQNTILCLSIYFVTSKKRVKYYLIFIIAIFSFSVANLRTLEEN